MAALTGKTFPAVRATAEHYARVLLKGQPYPGIYERHGTVTPGKLYSKIDAESLKVIDAFEDDIYVREAIDVTIERGEVVEALAYVVPEVHANRLGSVPWDADIFMARYGQEYIAMCQRMRMEFLDKTRQII